jgi:predicted CXXCH cytochrome family protein
MRARRTLLMLAGLMLAGATGWPNAQTPGGPQTPAAPQDLFQDDVHAKAGLACASCHAGAPPYKPIERTRIAPLCATCHSDADYMKKYNPQVRVDQYQQYLTSTHGKRMSTGETRVATCTDCHGAHGIRAVSDPRASVAPQHVANTCSRCHADHARMSVFGHEDSPPDDWKASVHAAALLKRGDTSAPTCSTCHGSHGAAPPGVTSVAFVCSQCHVREAELFRKSPKKAIFDVLGQGECVVCHSNHRIENPSDSFIGMQDPAICARCHNDELKGADTIKSMQKGLKNLADGIDRANAVLNRAESAGMLVDDGRLVVRDAREDQILTRVNVHAFADTPFAATAAKGMTEAAHAEAIGNAALGELRYRRNGLAVATLIILGFLVTLWWKIRRLPPTG